jgi:hypothetical protein
MKMAELFEIPFDITPVKRKKPPKRKPFPDYTKQILKAEAKKKAMERKITRLVRRQKALEAERLSKAASDILNAGYLWS